MEMVKTLTLMLFASTMVFLPKMEAQPYIRPLCVSQLSIVNYACAMLPYIPLPQPRLPPAPPSLDDEVNRHGHSHSHNRGHDHGSEQWPSQGHGYDHGQHGNHTRGHGQGHGHGHGQERRHSHRHRHRHRHAGQQESPALADCCRWLNELDDECVCDLLVRLPSFLAKPFHKYNVYLDETCNITYACEGRLLRP